MRIRTYQPGDESAQVEIYNRAAGGLPGFKPANVEEVSRRYRADTDPTSKLYAVDGERVVGYAVINPNGRISYPWCLPGSETAQQPLLDGIVAEARRRDCTEAWAAYRGDWTPVLTFLEAHGFHRKREMVNYVAEVKALPQAPPPAGLVLRPLSVADGTVARELGGNLFANVDAETLTKAYLDNPYHDPASAFTLREANSEALRGMAVAVINPRYADPTKLDAAMPCYRLGALGTETERHKRVNGMFSCIFSRDDDGVVLLGEAARRFAAAGLSHAAAQGPSDQPQLIAFYGRYFQRQGAFPILARRI